MVSVTKPKPVFKPNPKVSFCIKCGGPIFYLVVDGGCNRVWWHEDTARDFWHRAIPINGKNKAIRY